MYKFMMPAEKWDETAPNKRAILIMINRHNKISQHMHKMMEYYLGAQAIMSDSERKNKLVCNHAKDIADTASSYFVGEPITYNSDDDIQPLTDAFDDTEIDSVDGDNGIDLSVYGRAYEYIYVNEDKQLTSKNVNAETTFMVYDNSIEEKELFAVYYYPEQDDSALTVTRWVATIMTKNFKWVLYIENQDTEQPVNEIPEEHYLGEVPVIEYLNNKMALGDFELQIPLIDAYNALMSDRITDKENFIDAILALYGTMLADPDEDDTKLDEAQKRLKTKKILELPDGTKAEYLTRTFDESGVELLAKRIEQDIHKFAHIPCMSDESFGGNVSGVAMEFKLLGLENITKIKSRYYRKGLKKRLRIFCRYLSIMTPKVQIDYTKIKPTFTRALPKNLLELSQIIANLWGKLSDKTLISQLPFVTDVDAELEAVAKQQEEAVKQQQAIFGMMPNTPPEGEDAEEEIPEEVDE